MQIEKFEFIIIAETHYAATYAGVMCVCVCVRRGSTYDKCVRSLYIPVRYHFIAEAKRL